MIFLTPAFRESELRRVKYIFRWKLGQIEIEHTWAYSAEEARERAVEICRPATMKKASRKAVQNYLAEHGEVVQVNKETQ